MLRKNVLWMVIVLGQACGGAENQHDDAMTGVAGSPPSAAAPAAGSRSASMTVPTSTSPAAASGGSVARPPMAGTLAGSAGGAAASAGTPAQPSAAGAAAGAAGVPGAGHSASAAAGSGSPASGAAGSSGGAAASAGAAAPAGDQRLPCDVAAILNNRCLSCHGMPLNLGAPMSLVTWSDFQKPAVTDASKKVYEMVAMRVQDAMRPMPPGKDSISMGDKATLTSWCMQGAQPLAASAPACTK